MQAKQKTEITHESYPKIVTQCESDCPLGQIYDYASSLMAWVAQTMSDIEAKRAAEAPTQQGQEDTDVHT